MNERLSALADGELEDFEAQALMKRMPSDADLMRDWAIYHVIGEALRQERTYRIDIVGVVGRRLAEEPTVLAPRPVRRKRLQVYALSAAASAAAVAMVAWVMLQGQPPATMAPMAQGPAAVVAGSAGIPVATPVNAAMDDYLRAHQEYSPSTQILGVAPYIRTVSGESGRDPRR
ncbi:MAG TPA: sigma-E factor negative regulatory protein [Pelomicrobium sp.]|nr:sigma-E factor negative regulatory protein [Pelomicrobium sp.]